jgi:signal transduction histidine kinase
MKLRLPGGIRTSLTVALLLIVGGALGAAYLMVVPSLERRLVEDRLDELQRDGIEVAATYAGQDFSQPLSVDQFVATASILYNARTVVYQVFGPSPLSLRPLADSASSGRPVTDDMVAVETARTTQIARGRVQRGGRPYGEVAVPLLPSGNVLLLSASIEDQLATVRVVKRRLLYATGVALLIAAVLGSAAAAVHAQRIRRLERAANRIAEGKFDQPVVDHGEDELGELAAAFERMRVQLAQLDTARKEFVANASHELRTPLFSLGGFLELMSDEDLDEETRAGFLVTTREQVDRLTRLSADLLDLSRIDAGRLHVEQEEVVLADVARALVDELQAIAEGSGHALALDTAPDAWALADEERVLQIGRALVANAIAHTPPGTHVVVRTERPDGRAVLQVRNDGPGIPDEHAERIFDRFYRVEGPQASGSGLGLAIARELAEHMGGTVELSWVDGWTTFTLTLPAVAAAPEPVPVS